jgi:hypothetical protein
MAASREKVGAKTIRDDTADGGEQWQGCDNVVQIRSTCSRSGQHDQRKPEKAYGF